MNSDEFKDALLEAMETEPVETNEPEQLNESARTAFSHLEQAKQDLVDGRWAIAKFVERFGRDMEDVIENMRDMLKDPEYEKDPALFFGQIGDYDDLVGELRAISYYFDKASKEMRNAGRALEP
jgi:hypothetical protein